jgi:hypothetical protein
MALGLFAALPVGLGTASEGRANRPDVMGVNELKPGMKGYGLTVFEGTRPQKFDVEVIDVLNNFRPRQDLILIKTFHPRLEVAKVVAGMSGSPIYIDGKMIGAYAYGWSFGSEPVAGVTPIRSMLDDLARPLPPTLHGWPLFPNKAGSQGAGVKRNKTASAELGVPGDERFAALEPHDDTPDNRFAGAPLDYDLRRHRDQIAERVNPKLEAELGNVTARPVATPVLLGGMSSDAVAFAGDLLSPLGLDVMQAGGGGEGKPGPDVPTRYEAGGAIGVQLVSGDMSAMGLGTVTRVEGDLVSGFGHPMMQGGITALPTAVGKVLWFLASESRSFKLGMPVRPLGALVNDRQASIVVSHSAVAPVIPVHVQIHGADGAPYTDWDFSVAHDKFMAPTFVAVAIGNALQATASERQDVTWSVTSKVRFKDYGEIEVKDFGVAVGGTPDPNDFARTNVVGAVGAVLSNPWQPAFVESVNVDVRLTFSRDLVRLRGVELLTPEVEPGEPAELRLTLVPYDGPLIKRTVKVPLAKNLAGQRVKIDVEPGYIVQKEKAAPESLADLIRGLEDPIYPARSLVFSYVAGTGVAHKGQVAANLPPGAMDRISPQSSTLAPEEFKAEERHVVRFPAFVIGTDKVTVVVKANK